MGSSTPRANFPHAEPDARLCGDRPAGLWTPSSRLFGHPCGPLRGSFTTGRGFAFLETALTVRTRWGGGLVLLASSRGRPGVLLNSIEDSIPPTVTPPQLWTVPRPSLPKPAADTANLSPGFSPHHGLKSSQRSPPRRGYESRPDLSIIPRPDTAETGGSEVTLPAESGSEVTAHCVVSGPG